MIDPFDHALSDFIDNLPEEAEAARRLLEEAAPFSGHGDLPELAELATMLRAVPSPEPRPEWMAAAKARLMAAPVVPPEKRGLTWLGTMFLPLTQLTFPSLPRLSMPTPVLARAVVAAALVVTLGSMATSGSIARNPLLQVTGQQGPVAEAQQAIAALEQQLGGSDSSPRDIVLLSKQLQLADDAIDQAPPAEQPRLRAQLQGAVTAVRFDGTLENILNPTTVQVDGVAIQADAAMVQQLRTGQHISLQVTVTSNGKLQAVDVTPEAPAATSNRASDAVQTNSTSSSGLGSGARGSGHDGTAPPINQPPVSADGTGGAQTPTNSQATDGDSGGKNVKTSDASPTAENASSSGATQGNDSSANGKGKSFGALSSVVSSGNAGPDPSSTPAKHGAGDSPSDAPSKGASANAQASGTGSSGSSASASQSSGSDKKGSDKGQPSAPAATLQTPAATTTGPAASSSGNSGNSGKPAANSQSDSGKGDKGQGNNGKGSAPKVDAPQAPAPKADSGNSSPKSDNSGKKK